MRAALLDRWRHGIEGKRVALAEHLDDRVFHAMARLVDFGISPILYTDEDVRLPGVDVVKCVDDPLDVAAADLASGIVDGVVGGVTRPTADVMRAGLSHVGLAEGSEVASSAFLMILPTGRIVAYGDCGVVPDPNARQLAGIAIQTAATFSALVGETPRVAMLSFSTHGSAAHPRVEKVRQATHLAKAWAPSLEIDGELQFDAAFVPEVAELKVGDSPVAGRANVLIFPDLDAGNIAYKITERLGGAVAIGPLVQGLAAPMHDLSRGASVEDIVTVAVVAAYQAGL